MNKIRIEPLVVAENWAENVMRRAERAVERQSLQHKFRHQVVFWTSIIVVMKINLAIAVVLIPFLAALNHLFFDFIILLAALIVGLSYNFLLADVAHLERGHHFLAAVLVPLIAIANVFLIGGVVEQFFGSERESLWLLAVLYGVVFVLPYVFGRTEYLRKRFIKHPC